MFEKLIRRDGTAKRVFVYRLVSALAVRSPDRCSTSLVAKLIINKSETNGDTSTRH
jgi:hypothetical protein